jgi:MerR family transcriptional regulator, copper efflux regulator
MARYTIGETAARSGFTTSTLRYYEDLGLVPPAGRTESGYRLYDDADLARLGFITLAKQLGCSLDEIRDLIAVWEDDRCEPVQCRFHELVTAKIADTHRKIDELTAFAGQLAAVVDHLAGPAVEGPCRDDCACTSSATLPTAPVPLGPKPTAHRDPPPIACTLPPTAIPGRIGDWHRLLATSRARTTTPTGGLRIELDPYIDLAALARLVSAERRCCSFLAFAITVDGRGLALEVDAPEAVVDLMTTVFGAPGKGETWQPTTQ